MHSDPANGANPQLLVAGTSLGGLTAAALLAEQGYPVTLVAAGQDQPAPDTLAEQGGDPVMGCHGHLLGLFERLDLTPRIRWDRQLHLIDQAGRVDALAGDDLPAPLHLLRSMLGLSLFRGRERFALIRGLLALLQVSRHGRARLRGESFERWLVDHRQPPSLIDRFWSPITAAACGGRADQVPASGAIRVLQEGLLHHETAYELGVSSLTHQELVDRVQARVKAAGGQVLADGGLAGIETDGQRAVRVHLLDGQEVPVDHGVLATGPAMLADAGRALTDMDARFARLRMVEPLPRIDVHLRFAQGNGRPVMPWPHLVAQGEMTPLVLRRNGEGAGASQPVQHLQAAIPAAGHWIDRDAQQLAAEVEAELRRLLPAAEQAAVVERQVLKRPAAACAVPPEAETPGPAISGTLHNLELAGSWCETGWPASLEAAAAAGAAAAGRVLQALGQPATLLPEADRQPRLLYQLLSG
jgi:uncharacterized protein with NAD-binding domain and iron-sulfur cluster